MVSSNRGYRGIYLVLALASQLLVCCQISRSEDISLSDVLESTGRWQIINGLKSWDRRLLENEIEPLETFAVQNRYKDWALHYYSGLLLRSNKPEKYSVSTKIAEAERLFIKMRGGKVSSGTYDTYIEEIAGLGNDIVPMLIDLMQYRERHDFFRKDIAIKVMGVLRDERIVAALRSEIENEKHRNHLEQELLSLLQHDSSNETVDHVSEVIAERGSAFDQEYLVSFLSRSGLSNSVKMRLYSHYGEFKGYGKCAVIRGLGQVDDNAAFAQLVQILREKRDFYDDTFRFAAYELGKLKNSDPCPVILDVLSNTNDHASIELISVLAERRYLPAIGVLEERIEKAGPDASGVRCRIMAAGALCRMGKDYEQNAAIVREYLKKEYDPEDVGNASYSAVGWLRDEETVNILISRIRGSETQKEVVKWSIEALGQIGDESALPSLRSGLTTMPLSQFESIGDAIIAIGRKNNNEDVAAEGQMIKKVASFVRNCGGQQKYPAEGSPEAKSRQREYREALQWLRKHQHVIANIRQNADFQYNSECIVNLMKLAQIELVAKPGKSEYKPDETIKIELQFKNLGRDTLYFQREGTTGATFVVDGLERRFLQSAPAPYKIAGPHKSSIAPLGSGDKWVTQFQVHPKKEELPSGEYRAWVYYSFSDHYLLPEKGRFEGALSGSLVSNELVIKID